MSGHPIGLSKGLGRTEEDVRSQIRTSGQEIGSANFDFFLKNFCPTPNCMADEVGA